MPYCKDIAIRCSCESEEYFALCFFEQHIGYTGYVLFCLGLLFVFRNWRTFRTSSVVIRVRQCMNEICVSALAVAGIGGIGGKTSIALNSEEKLVFNKFAKCCFSVTKFLVTVSQGSNFTFDRLLVVCVTEKRSRNIFPVGCNTFFKSTISLSC